MQLPSTISMLIMFLVIHFTSFRVPCSTALFRLVKVILRVDRYIYTVVSSYLAF